MSRAQHRPNPTPIAGAAYLILLTAGFLSPTLTSGVLSQTIESRVSAKASAPTKSEIISTAAAIVRASTKLSQVWSGYWPEDQAFIINVEGLGALLISPGPKLASFEPVPDGELPPELKGRAFFHEGVLSGAQRPFVIDYPIGEKKSAILVNAKDGDAKKTMSLILHEQFHGYQDTAFKGKDPQFVGPLAIKDRVAFAATADLERSILVEALTARAEGERRQLIRQYFAVRRERERTVPSEVIKAEQGFERSEGTASYAEKAGLVALSGGDEAELQRLLVEQLSEDLTLGRGAYTTTWFRGRSYGTGATLTYLIGQYDREAWRAKIEGGAKLDHLLESLVGAVPARSAARMAQTARKRFGYEAKHRALEPIIRSAEKTEIKSIPEFLRLDDYQVVFEPGAAGAALRPGFRAVNMVDLDSTTLALPRAIMFNVANEDFTLTVRDRPVLLEAQTRFTVLLPAVPKIAGSGVLPLGEHRFENLRMSGDGFDLQADTPVTVRVEPHRMVVRLSS